MNEVISDEEWIRRFKRRVVERVGFTEIEAGTVFETCSLEEWKKYGDTPEEAADEELSNWD